MINNVLERSAKQSVADVAPAPLLTEIVNTPSEMVRRSSEPLYVVRNGRFNDSKFFGPDHQNIIRAGELDDSAAPEAYALALNEAIGLQNLHDSLQNVEEFLRSGDAKQYARVADRARLTRENIRVVGAQERNIATADMASLWLGRLAHSADGLLIVGTPQYGSKQYIVSEVLSTIEKVAPDARKAIYFINPQGSFDRHYKTLIKRNGLILPDDWTMSGSQMRNVMKNVHQQVRAKTMWVDLIASNGVVRDDMFGVTSVWSRFKYPGYRPYRYSEKIPLNIRPDFVSLVGSHGIPDFGYEGNIYEAFRSAHKLRDEHVVTLGDNHLPYPLMTKILKVYEHNEDSLYLAGDKALYTPFIHAAAKYKRTNDYIRTAMQNDQYAIWVARNVASDI